MAPASLEIYIRKLLLHHCSSHVCRVTRYHPKMMSDGEGIRLIIYLPALSPHQWPTGACPSTTSLPPTLVCCHSGSGMLIQCKHPSQYSLQMKIMNDTSHLHIYMKYLAIGISYGKLDKNTCARYDEGLLNGAMRKMVWKTTVRWIPISLEMYIIKVLLVNKYWRIGRIPFARRKFQLTGYPNKGIGGRRDGSNLSREKCS